jgi:hypothetical protein
MPGRADKNNVNCFKGRLRQAIYMTPISLEFDARTQSTALLSRSVITKLFGKKN